ncbi:MAG TPA: hypothetical protein DCZ92_02115 [Elusimicrobia bacterium]|nr:MAG: hypothetical protein A2016_08285 [Elusimicrobia bacterium GWF2_62_30]HBA59621.1 hypothetical protein [Elusimicrobiota bacterium]
MKAKFSIPFNGDLELVKEALASGQVAEVYYALPPGRWGSSDHLVRAAGAPSGAPVPALAGLCRAAGVSTNLLCNSPSLALTRLAPLFAAARRLKPDSVTLADPLFIGLFRRALPGVRIHASVIMNLNSEERARQALRAGAQTLTLAAEANRDLPLLRRIARLKREFPGFRLKLLANYCCGYDCVFMHAHYLAGMFPRSAGAAAASKAAGGCFYRGAGKFERLKRPFIRPEDLGFYEKNGVVDEFKLIARSQPSSVLRKIYNAYFSRKFSGDLGELLGGSAGNYGKDESVHLDNSLFPKGFASRVARCAKNCAACGYCLKVFERVTAPRKRRA